MVTESSTLKQIFEFVRDQPWCKARSIGAVIDGGKSVVNHYLYGYEGILFEKKGLTPPLWRVVSRDAYDEMVRRLNPTKGQGSGHSRLSSRPSRAKLVRALEPITVCGSCDTPIRDNGMCRCS